jgi:hypothetical protein
MYGKKARGGREGGEKTNNERSKRPTRPHESTHHFFDRRTSIGTTDRAVAGRGGEELNEFPKLRRKISRRTETGIPIATAVAVVSVVNGRSVDGFLKGTTLLFDIL